MEVWIVFTNDFLAILTIMLKGIFSAFTTPHEKAVSVIKDIKKKNEDYYNYLSKHDRKNRYYTTEYTIERFFVR